MCEDKLTRPQLDYEETPVFSFIKSIKNLDKDFAKDVLEGKITEITDSKNKNYISQVCYLCTIFSYLEKLNDYEESKKIPYFHYNTTNCKYSRESSIELITGLSGVNYNTFLENVRLLVLDMIQQHSIPELKIILNHLMTQTLELEFYTIFAINDELINKNCIDLLIKTLMNYNIWKNYASKDISAEDHMKLTETLIEYDIETKNIYDFNKFVYTYMYSNNIFEILVTILNDEEFEGVKTINNLFK